MKRLLLLFIPLLLFFACEKDDDNNNNDDCLNSMIIDNNEHVFTSVAMAEGSCTDDYYYYSEYDDAFCSVAVYLMGDGISLEEFEESYEDYYSGEVIEYSYWQIVGQGDVAVWWLYTESDEYNSLPGTYELNSGDYPGTYGEDSGYALDYDVESDDDPTGYFIDGTVIITETTNGLYKFDFNHEDNNGKSVIGCYDGLELVNYNESRMQESSDGNWINRFVEKRKHLIK